MAGYPPRPAELTLLGADWAPAEKRADAIVAGTELTSSSEQNVSHSLL